MSNLEKNLLVIFVNILLHLVDKGYCENPSIVEECDSNDLLMEHIFKMCEKENIKCLGNAHKEKLKEIFREEYITLTTINYSGIENNILLYLIDLSVQKINSDSCQEVINN